MHTLPSSAYRYSSIPLTANIAKTLLSELFDDGQVFERQKAVEIVLKTHLDFGGKPPTQVATLVVKKALQGLKEDGRAENCSPGYWKLIGDRDVLESRLVDSELDEDDESIVLSTDDAVTWKAEDTIGDGPHAVYVYFLPTYREYAREKKSTNWPCKIGMTTTSPLERVLSQAATALPEIPIVGLIIRTNVARAVEKSLHGILELRGRKILKIPGTEWFLTNPAEVKTLFELFQDNDR